MLESNSVVRQRPLRILSLDGGGYRGLASLEILDRLMHELGGNDGTVPKPCDHFDFIIGTSTGGLIAILLGRLHYSVEDARTVYIKFGERIFGKAARNNEDAAHWLVTGEDRYKIAQFEKALDELVPGDSLLKDCDPKCRVVVLTKEQEAVRKPVLLRSYATGEPLLGSDDPWAHDWTIKQAARATSAAATYFSALLVQDQGVVKTFEDAGLAGYNNPVREGIFEVRNRIPEFQCRPIGCVLSLGTGLADPNMSRRDTTNPDFLTWAGALQFMHHLAKNKDAFKHRVSDFFRFIIAIATDTERAHQEMLYDRDLSTVYFRGDVPGLGNISMDDISQREVLRSKTREWLETSDGKSMIDGCVNRLKSQTIPCFEIKPRVFGLPTCEGRTPIIESLSETIASASVSEKEFKPCSILIRGSLGIGKSTVALHVMHHERVRKAYGNRICYLPCDGTLSIAALKLQLLAMRVIDSGNATDDDIRQFLSAAPTLVCLDNFEELLLAPGGIQSALEGELLPLLASSASLIVTVRGITGISLNTARGWSSITTLEPLDASAARKALLRYTTTRAEPTDPGDKTALNKLVDKCDGHPLTIELLARLASARTFSDVIATLEEDADEAIANRLDGNPHTGSLGASIRLSVKERRVRETPLAIALCYALAMLPDGASRDFLERDLLGSKKAVLDAMALLVERGLAYSAGNFLRMLSPLRMFFEALDPHEYGLNVLAIYGAVRDFHFKLAQQSVFTCHNDARPFLFAQARNVEAAVMRDLSIFARNDDARSFLAQARSVEAAVMRDLSRPLDGAAFADVVNAACGVSGWYAWGVDAHSAPYLSNALRLAQKRGDRLIIARLLLEIGHDLRRVRKDESGVKAKEAFTEAYDVSMEYVAGLKNRADGEVPGMDHVVRVARQMAAMAREGLATLAIDMGDVESAEHWAEEALKIYEEVGHTQGWINALFLFAGISVRQGNTERAMSLYRAVSGVAEAREDKLTQANACCLLSELVPQTKDRLELLELAVTLYEAIGRMTDAAECRLAIEKLEIVS